LLGKEYFLHAYGPIYALSADVVSSLVALRNDRQVFFSPELAWPHNLQGSTITNLSCNLLGTVGSNTLIHSLMFRYRTYVFWAYPFISRYAMH